MRNPKRTMPVVLFLILLSYFIGCAGQETEEYIIEIVDFSDSTKSKSQDFPGKIEIYKMDISPEMTYLLLVHFPKTDTTMSSNWMFPRDSTYVFTHLRYFWQNDTLFQGWMFNPETGAIGDTLFVTKLNNGSSLRTGRRLK